MKLHFLTVPVFDSVAAEEEVNQFLASHRVLSVDRQLVADGARSAWALCVTFTEPTLTGASEAGKKGRVDYREVLSAAEFQVYAHLRALRKTIADREGVPAYALFTNDQLAAMVRQRVDSAAALGRIDGVGPARVEKYGATFLEALRAALAAPASTQGGA